MRSKHILNSICFFIALVFLVIKQCNAQQNLNIDSLKQLIKQLPDDTTKIKSLTKLSAFYMNSDPDKSKSYIDKALILAKKINDQKSIADSYNSLGVLMRNQGQYDMAIQYYKKSLRIYTSNKNKKGESHSSMNLGVTYGYKGDYTNALDFFLKALKINESTDNQKGIGDCYSNIGNIHYLLGNYQQSMNYHKNALNVFKKLEIESRISFSYSNIGADYEAISELSNAIKFYNKSLKIDQKQNDKYGICLNFCNIGNIFLKQQDYSMALEYYMNAKALAEEINDVGSIGYLDDRLSLLYFENKDYEKSIEYGKKSLSISKEIGDLETIKSAYYTLMLSYEKTNHPIEALEYLKLYTSVKDSILNEEKNKQLIEMEAKYQIEKKEQKIENQSLKISKQNADINNQRTQIIALISGVLLMILLFIVIYRSYSNKKKANLILSKQKEELNKALKYAEKLQSALKNDLSHYMQISFRKMMNPHFIFNSLNSIQSFILQNDKLEASLYLSKFSDLMRRVLDYSQSELISLKDELETLKIYVELEQIRFNGRFKWEILIDSSIRTEYISIPPLIFQPFVENAIWHGLMHKKEDGLIKIVVKPINSSILCSVEDNGIGREKSMEINKNKRDHQSFGIKATKERLNITNSLKNQDTTLTYSDLSDEDKNPIGTKVEFKIPLIPCKP